MKKVIIAIVFITLLIPNISHAFTKADIDLLVAIDVIENKAFIPLLYLLAEDTPEPTVEEIIATVAATKISTTSIDDAEKEDEDEEEVERIPQQPLGEITTTATIDDADFSGDDEKGIYTISFSVAAGGGDIWIEDEVVTSEDGFQYEIVGDTNFAGSNVAFVSGTSATTKQGGFYKIPENTSQDFTLQIELDPNESAAGGIWSIRLKSITFAESSGGANPFTYELSDKGRYYTGKLLIN